MAGRLTNYPNGLQQGQAVVSTLLSEEPTTLKLADGTAYLDSVKSGGTKGSIWMESGGLKYNVAGTVRTVPLTSTASSNDLDTAYALGQTISISAGAITLNDATTGAGEVISITKSGAGSGNTIDINYSAAATGNALDVNMTNNVAGGALVITSAGARTDALIDITDTSTSNNQVLDYTSSSGVKTGNVLSFSIDSACTTGAVIDIDMNAGVAYKAIYLDAGAAIRTVDLIDVVMDGSGNKGLMLVTESNTGSGHLIDVNVSGVGSGNVLDIVYSAADTGNAISVDMASNVAGAALYVASTGARTDSLVELLDAGTGNVALLNIATTGIYTGELVKLSCNTAAASGNILSIDCDTNVAGYAVYLDGGAAIRTSDLIGALVDGSGNKGLMLVTESNTGSGHLIDINVTGIGSGNALDITYSAADTGDAISVVMANNVAGSAILITGAGARTDDLIKIDDSSTGNSQIFDINLTGAYTGNVIDIALGATTVAASALKITTSSGTRTVGDILIVDGGTASAPNIDINIDGIMTGNSIDITYGTAAATGNAVDLNMGTNVEGMAIDIDTAATGVNNKGCAIDILHTGASAQGAAVVRIDSTGNYANADGNTVEIIQRTGAGQVGNNALYISATGTNVEAIKVDDGAVVFDETLTVTGFCTLTKGSIGGITAVSGAGAVSVATPITRITSTGVGDAITLADGTAGQIVTVVHEVDGGSIVITPTTATGYTTLTSTAAGHGIQLLFVTTQGWIVIGNNGFTLA